MTDDTLPRYVRRVVKRDRTILYHYVPPQKYVDLGLVRRQVLTNDIRSSRRMADELTQKVDEWKDQQRTVRRLRVNDPLSDLIKHYKQSYSFKQLRDNSQKEYDYVMRCLLEYIGDEPIGGISVQDAKQHYNRWLEHGIYRANKLCRIASVLFNHALDNDFIPVNPFSRVKRRTPEQRKVVWEHDQVLKFLETAYGKWEWRNVGLIAQMAYVWVQRAGDMRMLEWDNVNLDKKAVTLTQSKRRAKVHLPIEDDLHQMLVAQEKDFGFQKYVAPRVKPISGEFRPYGLQDLSTVVNAVIKAAGLPSELRISDLRRTGATQMVEGGVPTTSIMQVTGHANPTSLKPYLKNTLRGATEALKGRLTG